MHLTLFIIIIIALVFEFINGFHDTANVVASSIATRSLSPYQAIIVAAIFNFFGAFSSSSIVHTIAGGLFSADLISFHALLATLLAAISWNLFTWSVSLPSSSSHALIGSLVGSVIASNGFKAIAWTNLWKKVGLPMILSPIVAFFCALLLMLIMMVTLRNNENPRKLNNFMRELQVLSASLLAYSHGANDAQKTIAVITLALLTEGIIADVSLTPKWVIIICALTISFGTLFGGMKIIKTLSTRVAKLKPVNGVAVELSAGGLIFLSSYFGLPLSTTHATSGAIMGAGFASGRINWKLIKNMVQAWILTIPVSAGISMLIYNLVDLSTVLLH
jgi:PiT family inorganic phosphate transporter